MDYESFYTECSSRHDYDDVHEFLDQSYSFMYDITSDVKLEIMNWQLALLIVCIDKCVRETQTENIFYHTP
jgi:hypothetical protein